MQISSQLTIISGGASGLGEACAREFARLGARVALFDRNLEGAQAVAADIGSSAHAFACDITDTASVESALSAAESKFGPARILLNVAGIGTAKRLIQKDGSAAPLEDFARVVNVNLIGTYNLTRLFAARCAALSALDDGERGVVMFTSSVAAYEGQIGQQAYSASKGGIVGMTLPMARDLARHGIRANTIAPGLFATPLMMELPEAARESLASSIPFPSRLGRPDEFARLAAHMTENVHLNGEVIRLDGALRLAPR
jgi:NAD(P)-dependent dehydrogenase (short-subunit alcohol dehydrogenase family)